MTCFTLNTGNRTYRYNRFALTLRGQVWTVWYARAVRNDIKMYHAAPGAASGTGRRYLARGRCRGDALHNPASACSVYVCYVPYGRNSSLFFTVPRSTL